MTVTNSDCAELAAAMHVELYALPRFGGVRNLDAALEVSVASDDAGALKQFRLLHASYPNPAQVPLLLRSVRYSYDELLDATARVSDAHGVVSPYGIYITTCGPSIAESRVEIALSDFSEPAARTLYAIFGDIIAVRPIGRRVAPALT